MGCRANRTTPPSPEEDTMIMISVTQIADLGSTPARPLG